MATPSSALQNRLSDFEQRVVEAAIAMAEEVGWENVRLRLVAERLDIPLTEIGSHFRDLDAVANAWFPAARRRMQEPRPAGVRRLAGAASPGNGAIALVRATSTHRQVTVQMLTASCGRFIRIIGCRCLRPVADDSVAARCRRLDAGSPRREMEEVGLTWLFLLTLLVWANDDSEGQARTRRFLQRRLADADALMTLLFGSRTPRDAPAESRGAAQRTRSRAGALTFLHTRLCTMVLAAGYGAGKSQAERVFNSLRKEEKMLNVREPDPLEPWQGSAERTRTIQHPLVMFQREMDRLFEEFRVRVRSTDACAWRADGRLSAPDRHQRER